MNAEQVRAGINLHAVLRSLEDLSALDPDAAALCRGHNLAIRFRVPGIDPLSLLIGDSDITAERSTGPGGLKLLFSSPRHFNRFIAGHALPLPALKAGEVRQMAYQLMNEKQAAEFERDLEMNLAVSVSNSGRFRINLYYQRGEVSMVARLIKSQIPSIRQLGLPAPLEKLALLDRGLILVTGAAGSGKSTTLAALLDLRNRSKAGHIKH